MKRWLSLFAVAGTAMMCGLGVGCSSVEPETVTSSAALTQAVRLDRVTPKDVAEHFAARQVAPLAACVAAHPTIRFVDASNVDTFTTVGADVRWSLRFALRKMIEQPEVSALEVATLPTTIRSWAARELGHHVDGEGFYVGDVDGFASATRSAREAKAIALAAPPGGKPLSEIRALWATVEADRPELESAWLNPVRLSETPSVPTVREVMGIAPDYELEDTDVAAVAAFHEAEDGPGGVTSFEPLRAFLESRSVVKRWFFVAGRSAPSGHILVVLDDQRQLWGLSMGYTE